MHGLTMHSFLSHAFGYLSSTHVFCLCLVSYRKTTRTHEHSTQHNKRSAMMGGRLLRMKMKRKKTHARRKLYTHRIASQRTTQTVMFVMDLRTPHYTHTHTNDRGLSGSRVWRSRIAHRPRAKLMGFHILKQAPRFKSSTELFVA